MNEEGQTAKVQKRAVKTYPLKTITNAEQRPTQTTSCCWHRQELSIPKGQSIEPNPLTYTDNSRLSKCLVNQGRILSNWLIHYKLVVLCKNSFAQMRCWRDSTREVGKFLGTCGTMMIELAKKRNLHEDSLGGCLLTCPVAVQTGLPVAPGIPPMSPSCTVNPEL